MPARPLAGRHRAAPAPAAPRRVRHRRCDGRARVLRQPLPPLGRGPPVRGRRLRQHRQPGTDQQLLLAEVGGPRPRPCRDNRSRTDPGCAYDYCWHAAADALAVADRADRWIRRLTWWLDVEIANSWNGNGVADAAGDAGCVRPPARQRRRGRDLLHRPPVEHDHRRMHGEDRGTSTRRWSSKFFDRRRCDGAS